MAAKTLSKFVTETKKINFIKRFRVRITKRRLIILGIITALILGISFYRSRQPKFEVDVATAQEIDLTESITSSGSVSADLAATFSFKTVGQLTYLNIKEGVWVQKGEMLARLDTTVLNSAYEQAQSNLRAAEASLERIYDSVKGQNVGESFTAKDTRTTYEVNKDNAYEQVIIARDNLRSATIYAPFTGIATNLATGIAPGVNVSPATPVFSLINPNTTYFDTEVGELDVSKLKVGQKSEITLDAYPDEILDSKVESIGYASFTTSTGGSAYKVRLTMPANIDLKYRYGMNGDAEFILSENKDVLVVPASAILEEDGKTYVYTVNGTNIAHKKEVTTGISSINDTEIKDGITAGEKVVLRPPTRLTEGDKVRIKI
jgi:RND family efflux transporter MFP subunit